MLDSSSLEPRSDDSVEDEHEHDHPYHDISTRLAHERRSILVL